MDFICILGMVMKYLTQLLLSISFLLVSSLVCADVFWEQEAPKHYGSDFESYLISHRAPIVSDYKDCSGSNCIYYVRLGERELKGKSLSVFEFTRYKNIAYAVIKDGPNIYIANSKDSKKHYIDYEIPKGGLSLSRYKRVGTFPYAAVVEPGVLLYVKSKELRSSNNEVRALPSKPLFHTFGTSLNGDWAMAFIGKDYRTYLVNGYGVHSLGLQLSKQSDVNFTLSVYPMGKNEAWVAQYEYRNKRNKSLWLHHYKDGQSKRYLVMNTIENDRGMKPHLYVDVKGMLRLSTETLESEYHYTIDPKKLKAQKPPLNPYPKQDILELNLGAGVRYTRWDVMQSVDDPRKGDSNSSQKFAKVSYKMNDSFMREFSVSGRLFGNDIVLSQLKSDAQSELNSYERAASERLYGAIGFNRLFSGPSTLRLEYTYQKIGGVAKYSEINKENERAVEFVNEYKKISLIKTTDWGYYYGLTYAKNDLPMALGFYTSNNATPVTYFDPELGLVRYGLSFGFRTAQYTQRYMFNQSRFYFDTRFGIDSVSLNISDDIKEKVIGESGNKLKGAGNFGLSFSLEAGYLWQVRSVKAGGLGLTFQAGGSIDIDNVGNSLSDEDEIEEDEILVSFERTDIRWGPFARLSLVF